MKRFARALLFAFPIALAACGQSTAGTGVPTPDQALLGEVPSVQEPSMAAAGRYATGFEDGNVTSTRHVYVFFDPQCPHCGRFWGETKALRKDVHFTWVPVSVLNRMSLPQGAAILSAKSPVATMDEHEQKLQARAGGLSAPAADPHFQAIIERNTRLLESFGATGVPFILGVNAQTGKVYAQSRGMPAEKLAEVLGWAPAIAPVPK